MILSNVLLTDFLCHHNLELEFGPGHFFVRGNNGSGKSAIYDALTFALWRRARSLDKRGGGQTRLVRKGTKSGSVEVTFHLDKEYRTIAPIGKQRVLYENGREVAHGDATLSYLQKEVGCSYEMFVSSVLRLQSGADSLLALEPKLRIQKLADIVGCSFEFVVKALNTKKTETNGAIKSLQELQLSSPSAAEDTNVLKTQCDQLQKQLTELQFDGSKIFSLQTRQRQIQPITKESFSNLDNVEKQIVDTAVAVKEEKSPIQALRDILKQWAGVYNVVGELKYEDVEQEKTTIASTLQELQTQQTQFQQIQMQLQQLRGRLVNEERYAGLRQKVIEAQTKLAGLQEAYKDIRDLVSFFGPKGITLLALRGALSTLEGHANHFLLEFDRTVNITDQFDVEVIDGKGRRVYEVCSGGEQFLVDIALRFGLVKMFREVGICLDCFFIDEGLGSLDETNLLLFSQTLRQLMREFKQTIVTTHLPNFMLPESQEIWIA